MSENQHKQPIRLFAEAEEKRLRDMMLRVQKYDTTQMVRACYDLPKRQVMAISKIPNFKSNGVYEDYNELLKEHKITDGAEFIFNDSIKSILHNFIMELIRQGLVVCEIKDNPYDSRNYRVELSAVVGVPPITRKRLDVDIAK